MREGVNWFVIVLIVLLSFDGQAGSSVVPISKVTGSHNLWPPYVIDESSGFSVEVVGQAFANQNIRFQFMDAPFSRSMRLLNKHKIDIIPALWWSKQRAETVLFSQSYFHNNLVLVSAQQGVFHFSKIDELSGRSVCVIRGYRSVELLGAVEGILLVQLNSLNACIIHLSMGRVQHVVADELAILYLKQRNPRFTSLYIHQEKLAIWPLHIGINRHHPNAEQIISAFNQGLQTLKNSGVYHQILAKYGFKQG
ncbi:substrate-binding periplasmic protein (plasmid) [Pseudoalteromonas sp. T1lg65]|uniref:substrate-binding periplasmic protein n=1 Tax=Pseudoalteromonas sp. T1lg65 TaxID=2077101 RepID=UPI003F790E4C